LIAAYDAATQAASKRGEAVVKALDKEQADHNKVAEEIARLTQEEYQFKIGQLERWKDRLQAAGKWSEENQALYAARRLAIEKDHSEKLAKEEKKRTDKAIAEAKRKEAEQKKLRDKAAREERAYSQLMATIGDKTLSDKDRALAQLDRQYEAYYEKLAALAYTDHERNLRYKQDKAKIAAAYLAERSQLIEKYSKKERSAFEQVMADWADGYKHMSQVTSDVFTDIRRMAGDILYKGIKGEFDSLGDAWQAVMDSMLNTFAQALAQMAVIWATTNIGRWFTGGDYFPFFDSLAGKGGGSGGAGGVAQSLVGSLLKKGLGVAAEKMGIPTSLEGWTDLLGLTGGGSGMTSGASAYMGTGESLGMYSGMDASSIAQLGEEIAAGLGTSGTGAMGGGAGEAMAQGLANLGIDETLAGVGIGAAGAGAASLASGASAYLGGMYGSMTAAELAALGEGAAAMAGIGGGAAAGGSAAGSAAAGAGAGASMMGALPIAAILAIAMAMGMPDPISAVMSMGGGHTKASALNYIGGDIGYLQRAEQSAGGLSLQDMVTNPSTGVVGSGSAVQIDRLAERAGLSEEQIDNLILGVDDLMAKYEELNAAAEEAAKAGDQELAESLKQQAEATAQAAAETQAYADALGFDANGLSAVGAAMYEAAQAQAVLQEQTAQIATTYQDWNGSAEQVRSQVAELVGVLEAAGVNTEGMTASTADLINQMLEGNITLDQMTQSLNNTFSAALEKAAQDGSLTAEEMEKLTGVLTGAMTAEEAFADTAYKVGDLSNQMATDLGTAADAATTFGEEVGTALVDGIGQGVDQTGGLANLMGMITEGGGKEAENAGAYGETLGIAIAEGVGAGVESAGELNDLAGKITEGQADRVRVYAAEVGTNLVEGVNEGIQSTGELTNLMAEGLTEGMDATIETAVMMGDALAESAGKGAEAAGELLVALGNDLTGGMIASAKAASTTTAAINEQKQSMQAASEAGFNLAEGQADLAGTSSLLNMESGELNDLLAQLSEKMGVDLLGSTEDVVKALGKGEKGFTGVSGLATLELSKENGLIKHLLEAGGQAEDSAGKVQALAEWIAALQDKEINVIANVYRKEHTGTSEEIDTAHSGGRIGWDVARFHTGGPIGADYPELQRYHTGSLVRGLASDEVPIIAKLGEYMVRSESVTPATLPILEGINRYGTAGLGGDVNVSVYIGGDVIGEAGAIERITDGVEAGVMKALDRREAEGEESGAPRRLEVRI
jgi:hypothetical protein